MSVTLLENVKYLLGVDKFNKAEPTVCSSTYKKSDVLLSWKNIFSKKQSTVFELRRSNLIYFVKFMFEQKS